MRIFQSLHAETNRKVPASQTWLRNLYHPLVELGHEVILHPSDYGYLARIKNSQKLRDRFSQRLLDRIKAEHHRAPLDLFFAYFTDGMVDPGLIREISRLGIPTCNFSCNNTHQFYLVEELSPVFDYNLHAEKEARKKFLDLGANSYWWPMASNPTYFSPRPVPREIPVSFVGGNYSLRARYIGYLLANDLDVHAYGPGWTTAGGLREPARRIKYLLQAAAAFNPETRSRASARLAKLDFSRHLSRVYPDQVHPPVTDEELITLYSRSQISLGFLEVFDKNDPSQPVRRHLHLREFEAPLCGALLCTGYSDELAEMFDPESEVITYRNQFELLDKVNYYLGHPDRAEEIRQAGRQRALQEHTYQHRYQTLFADLGLGNGSP